MRHFEAKMKLEKKFQSFLEGNHAYEEALKLIKKNSSGEIWLIGGFVWRNLAHLLHDTGEPESGDIDFIVSGLNHYLITGNWGVRQNSYGNPKFRKGEMRVDVVPLNNIASIMRRKLKPTIESYLTGTPLSIQSIAYEVSSGKLLGPVGLDSLNVRVIKINDLKSAKNTASKKGLTLKKYIEKFANSLNFQVAP